MVRYLFFVFFFLFQIIVCYAKQKDTPIAQKGVLDLRNWNFANDGIIDLNGEWSFYYKKLLQDAEIEQITDKKYLHVPGTWMGTSLEGKPISGFGYATYQLLILLPRNCPLLSIKVSEVNTEYDLIINGKKIDHQGIVGTDESTMKASFLPKIIDVGNSDTLRMVFHISNFQHVHGGLWAPVKLGITQDIHNLRERNLFFSLLLSGFILLMFFSHLEIYLARKTEISSFYFAFVCLFALARNLVMDEAPIFLLMQSLSDEYELIKKVEFCSFFLMVPAFYSFIHTLYPGEYNLRFLRFNQLLGITFSIADIFTPVAINSRFIPYFQFFLLIGLLYLCYVCYLIVRRKREDALVFILCILFIVVAGINDVLYFNKVLNNVQLLPYAIFGFLYLQSYIISRRTTGSFKKNELLTLELKSMNATLESQVESRTSELNENLRLVQLQKDEIEAQHEETVQLNNQVELKNKQLADWQYNLQSSIQYAKRIQNAILPLESEIKPYFKDFFIFFKPKDIVSGDFYYFNQVKNKIIIAAVDCTGHGVPGAFMSLIANQLFYETIVEREILEPDKILNRLHVEIRRVLKQQETDNRDGMDMSLIVIDKEKNIVEYAGAKNPLVYFQENMVYFKKGDRMPIGGEQLEEERIFTKHIIDISIPTTFYLFSDGFQDQFGGEKSKKFMFSKLKDLLTQIHEKPLPDQKDILYHTFEDWRKISDQEQVDDVLILGVCV